MGVGNNRIELPENVKSCQKTRRDEAVYKERAKDCGICALCDALYLNLCNPPSITEERYNEILQKANPQIPNKIGADVVHEICKECKITIKLKE